MSMTDILDKIATYTRQSVAAAKAARPVAELEAAAREAPPVRSFKAALEARIASGGYGLIAEIKRASPSRGLIRADFEPASLARAYEAGGAACLSILTDTPSFQGHPEHLKAARAATALPVLRKDFMVDVWQVAESRAMGADCILVIMAVVADDLARALLHQAVRWGMDVLVEVHDEDELDRALALGDAPMIGINNRDLRTFETRLETTERLAPRIPAGRLVVGESGLASRADLDRLAKVGVQAFLIGESLMRAGDVTSATRALLTPEAAPTSGGW